MKKGKKIVDDKPLFVPRHLDIKTYEYKKIKVTVKINFDDKQISLVEKAKNLHARPCFGGSNASDWDGGFITKPWVFVNREVEYMQGWLDILEAMKFAIKQGQSELENYLGQKLGYETLIQSIEEHKFEEMLKEDMKIRAKEDGKNKHLC